MRRALLATLVAVVGVALLSPAAQAQAAPGFTTSYQTIPGDGGTPIRAFVIEPTGRGTGPFPVLVMPGSWASPNLEYVGAAGRLAYESGYVVVSYTARGFWDSGGEIDVAGPLDVADASKVIDWAVANAKGDPSRIGMAGISYGAGISLLTAAADQRVRAVSAMSGWADLARSMYPNQTINNQAVAMLLGSGAITGRPGPELRQITQNYLARDGERMVVLAPSRSAATKLDAINANKPAIMIANAWNDSLFPPEQISDFYTGLTGPKRLELVPGDHGTAEGAGAVGLPSETWASTGRWFDHHLRGVDNGIDRENAVNLKPNNGGTWRTYPDLAAATTRHDTLNLTPKRINAGWDTIANSGTLMVSGALQQFANIPTGVYTPLINRNAAGVWTGPTYGAKTTVSGEPRLHVTVTPSARTTSLFGYLYDVDQLGFGALVTHKAMTLRDTTPGVPKTLDFTLQQIRWDVPARHKLVLVVDTVDPRYLGESAVGSTVTFSSPAGNPSWLRVPIG